MKRRILLIRIDSICSLEFRRKFIPKTSGTQFEFYKFSQTLLGQLSASKASIRCPDSISKFTGFQPGMHFAEFRRWTVPILLALFWDISGTKCVPTTPLSPLCFNCYRRTIILKNFFQLNILSRRKLVFFPLRVEIFSSLIHRAFEFFQLEEEKVVE